MSGDCNTGTAVQSWNFGYDGDGVRTTTSMNYYDAEGGALTPTFTKYYFGGAYETRPDGSVLKYYSLGGQSIMRDANGLHYMLSDHLGSVVAITDSTGTLTSQQRYLPFGQVRTDVPSPNVPSTDFTYTGQRSLDAGMGGLMDYKARFYSQLLMRFIQPDTIIPSPGNPQAFNRYSYVLNSPIGYNDPTGHQCSSNKTDDDYCPGYSGSTVSSNRSNSGVGNPSNSSGGNGCGVIMSCASPVSVPTLSIFAHTAPEIFTKGAPPIFGNTAPPEGYVRTRCELGGRDRYLLV